jgi:uncharacterized protein (TIGR00251 family)
VSFLLTVRAQPGASKTEILGVLPDGSLKVRLKARPVKGEANRELVSLLASRLRVAASAIKVVRGHTSRIKLVYVEGIDHTTAAAALKGV